MGWMTEDIVGREFGFDYPAAFVTLPDYTAHAGMVGVVTRRLGVDENESELEGGEVMYEMLFEDGFVAHAFESELIDVGD